MVIHWALNKITDIKYFCYFNSKKINMILWTLLKSYIQIQWSEPINQLTIQCHVIQPTTKQINFSKLYFKSDLPTIMKLIRLRLIFKILSKHEYHIYIVICRFPFNDKVLISQNAEHIPCRETAKSTSRNKG